MIFSELHGCDRDAFDDNIELSEKNDKNLYYTTS